ncbi:MAG: hypothetical protein HRU41_38930 [Saprospiraceae bacterium]|nr:hypothetical protein [Saprospiraceae bacterium]
MKNVLLTILMGAVALFLWNAISWMGLQLHNQAFQNLPDTSPTADFIQQLPGAGVYHFPGIPEDGDLSKVAEKAANGPVVSLMIAHPSGRVAFSGGRFFLSFIYNLLSVAIVVFLLSQTAKDQFWSKWSFVAIFGAFAAICVELPIANWYGIPAAYFLPNLADHLIGWSLVGLIAAKMIKL